MSYDDANSLLSGGSPVAKFPEIGTVVRGTVIDATTSQQTDIENKPKYFDNGDPMMQVVVTLQTDERDPEISEDDGTRRLFVKGQMLNAVRTALRTAGAKLETGGRLAVQYTADKPSERRGYSPTKIYVAQYQPPKPGTAAANDLLGTGSSQPSAASLIG